MQTRHNFMMDFKWTSLLDFMTEDSAYEAAFHHAVQNVSENHSNFTLTPIIDKALACKTSEDFGAYFADILQGWRDGDAPSNAMIAQSALHYFEIESSHQYYSAVMVAGVLADIPHDNIYHNNHHFREVIVLLCLLMAKHNAIAPFKLSSHDIALLLIAACIHDFSHDGEGNILKGAHMPSRLEKRAFSRAEPFLAKALSHDTQAMDKIALFLICTDVSRGETGRSPAGYCRDIFLAHEYDNVHTVNVPDMFDPLIKNPMLSTMASLLCEADVGISTGLTYAYAKRMTCLVAQESDVLMPSANTLFGFMDVICHGGFSTRAARHLMSDNFQSIRQSAEQDMDNNVLYA